MTAEELRLEDYKRSWDLFLVNIQAMERNETYSIGSMAVVMSFSVASKDSVFAIGSAILTILIAYLGRMRYVGFGLIARALNAHLLEVEKRLEVEGWLTFRRQGKVGERLRSERSLLWTSLFAASIALTIAVFVIHWPALPVKQ